MDGLRAGLLSLALLMPLYGGAADALRLVADSWPPFTDKTLLNNGLATDLVVTALIRFLQRKGSQIEFHQLSDLYPYSIAVVRGYAYSSAFDQDSRLSKVGVLSFAVGVRMLQAQRVQLALEDELVARFHLGRHLTSIRDQLEFLPQPLSENGLHILVSRRHPQHQQIADAFNKAIEAMRADGSYEQIFQRHGL